MAYNDVSLNFKQQLELLKSRGIKVNNEEIAIRKLQNISYYKIKEFLEPYQIIEENKELKYKNGISIEMIIKRFYQDKNIRLYLLHAIEKIELALKTQIAYTLGIRSGFRYLKFNNWCNKEEYCKHYLELKQQEFKKNLKELIHRSNNLSIKEFYNDKENKHEFPPIWMSIDVLTLGNLIHLMRLMSKNNKQKIADYFKCTSEELDKWLKLVKFVRNKCAHNSNIIDAEIKTMPPLREEWKSFLFSYEKEGKVILTNRLAVALVIVNYFVKHINEEYKFGDIHKALLKLIQNNDNVANKLGFKNSKAIDFFFNKEI